MMIGLAAAILSSECGKTKEISELGAEVQQHQLEGKQSLLQILAILMVAAKLPFKWPLLLNWCYPLCGGYSQLSSLTVSGINYNSEMEDSPVIQTLSLEDSGLLIWILRHSRREKLKPRQSGTHS